MDENLKKQLVVNDSDKPVNLKQGHQTGYELGDPKQGYNNAQLKKNLLEQCL